MALKLKGVDIHLSYVKLFIKNQEIEEDSGLFPGMQRLKYVCVLSRPGGSGLNGALARAPNRLDKRK